MKKKMIVLIAVSCFSHGACANDNWTLFDTTTYTTTYQVKDYNQDSTCAPTNGLGYDSGISDVLGIQDPNIGFECNILIPGDGMFHTGYGGDKPCPSETKIAVAGAAKCVSPIIEFNVTEQGAALIWQCEDDSAGLDEWNPFDSLPDCGEDKYTRFKNKRNAIPVLVSPQTDAGAFYKVYIDPPTDTCVAYLCDPETSHPSYNPLSDEALLLRNIDSYQCYEHNTKCGIYLDGEQMYMPTNYQLDSNSDVLDQQNGKSYRQDAIENINIDDSISDPAIQKEIQKLFDNEITGYNTIFEYVEMDDGIPSFYQVRTTAFNGQTFSYYCFSDGIKVIVSCPKFFTYDNGKCKFDKEGVQDAIDQKQAKDAAAAAAAELAEAEARKACATAICGASGGVYSGGDCKCRNVSSAEDYICTDDYNGYEYCGGVEGDLGFYFCDNNVLKLGLPPTNPCYNQDSAQKCYEELVREAYKKTPECATAASSAAAATSNATNDATANDDAESISELAKTLDAIEDAYGLSKWRTVDGKFNYARLASDATAAVVLGTTGALVTSSVVKKKQVEAGFESLECTVGGQHVGDWGDVFRIDGK